MNESILFNLGDGYILAVEDSLVQAKRLEYFFKNYKIQYQIFPNAEDAYDAALKSPPKLIISDIMLTGMDGYEFCRRIKSNHDLSDIPVILLTSLQEPDDIIKGLQANADNFLTKPYDNKNLLSRINHLLENNLIKDNDSSRDDLMINFRGNNYIITSSKKQILELLLSVYDTSVQQNEELIAIKAKLEKSNEDILLANRDMELFSQSLSNDLSSSLNLVLKSSSEMSKLIKDMLVFSQSGTIGILQDNINLSEIANELIIALRLRYQGKSFDVIIDPDLKTKADPKMIRILLDNLLDNAFKNSSKIEKPVIIFGRKEYYGNDLYFIKDNGTGSGDDFSGTGVGLSTVKRIIEKHGGHIWTESEVDMGSTFYFTLN